MKPIQAFEFGATPIDPHPDRWITMPDGTIRKVDADDPGYATAPLETDRIYENAFTVVTR